MDIPDLAAFRSFWSLRPGVGSMKGDGVHADMPLVLEEG